MANNKTEPTVQGPEGQNPCNDDRRDEASKGFNTLLNHIPDAVLMKAEDLPVVQLENNSEHAKTMAAIAEKHRQLNPPGQMVLVSPSSMRDIGLTPSNTASQGFWGELDAFVKGSGQNMELPREAVDQEREALEPPKKQS